MKILRSPVARAALIAAAIVALLGCATPLGRHGSDRLHDLGDSPIVGGGFGGLIIFGSGGGIEAGFKATELVVPVIGASEMHEFEISNSQFTRQFERTLGFPISPIYSLLTRKIPENAPTFHAADVIHHEAQRMAEIVRKIGRLTKYETKSYVGQQRIVDLDGSTNDDPNREPPS